MSEQDKQKMLDALDRVIDEAANVYSAGKEFVADQAPQLVQEILRWGMARAILQFIGTALVVTCCSIAIAKLWKQYSSEPLFLVPIFIVILPFFGCIESIYTIVKIWVAPRLYIIEHGMKILRGR